MNKSKVILEKQLKSSKKQSNLYHNEVIERKVVLPYKYLGSNLEEQLVRNITKNYEGKCIKEGYIKKGSCSIVSYTYGYIDGSNVTFHVMFNADVCYPYEDMRLSCIVENITKIGIKAIVSNHENPIVVFISREHNLNTGEEFDIDGYEEGDTINIKVIGHRFEINDEYTSVLGEIIV